MFLYALSRSALLLLYVMDVTSRTIKYNSHCEECFSTKFSFAWNDQSRLFDDSFVLLPYNNANYAHLGLHYAACTPLENLRSAIFPKNSGGGMNSELKLALKALFAKVPLQRSQVRPPPVVPPRRQILME